MSELTDKATGTLGNLTQVTEYAQANTTLALVVSAVIAAILLGLVIRFVKGIVIKIILLVVIVAIAGGTPFTPLPTLIAAPLQLLEPNGDISARAIDLGFSAEENLQNLKPIFISGDEGKIELLIDTGLLKLLTQKIYEMDDNEVLVFNHFYIERYPLTAKVVASPK